MDSNVQFAIPPTLFSARDRRRGWVLSIISALCRAFSRCPEMFLFVPLLIIINAPVVVGSTFHSMIFQADAVRHGEWWRLFTHPFVHVTWYHLLLDGTACVALYGSLMGASVFRRVTYIIAGAAGSLALSWAGAPGIATSGLCGLSGIAHGLMAVSALEMISTNPPGSAEHRIGWISFLLVVAKAAFEAVSGRMFFAFLDFGLLGSPVAVSHAGGIIGCLAAVFVLSRAPNGPRPNLRAPVPLPT